MVKDHAGIFRTRIELRQIGVRDEARMLGGLGICGRPFCCGTFMEEFQPVSTKMAKTQSMSLNPAKISGSCGRLMCCLRYEQSAYEELVKNVPKNGAFVETPDGYGNVTQVNILRQTVKVKLDGPGDDSLRSYDAEDVAAIPGGRPRDGSQPPHTLVLKPKKTVEPEDTGWSIPERLISSPADLEKAARQEDTPKKTSNRRRNKKESAAADPQAANRSQKPPKNRTQKPDGNAEKTEGEAKPRPSKKRRKGPRTPKPPQDGVQAAPAAAQEKRPPKTPNKPAAATPKPEGGEQKPKKSRNNRRRNYKPRPKSGGDGGTAANNS